jgi:hypothetical protein
MRRGTVTQVSSALRQVQSKARQVLKSLAQEIRAKESELRRFWMTRPNSLRSLDSEVLLLVGRSMAYLEKGPVESIGKRFWRDSPGSSGHPKSAPCAGSRISGPLKSSRRLLAGRKQAR